MIFNVNANSVNISPIGRQSVSCEIDCESSDIINQISIKDVVDIIGTSELLSEIDESDVINHFKKNILNNFDIDEILEVFSIEDIIKHIGEDYFREYIRDIMIDKLI